MKISPFLAAIPLLLLGGTSAPSQETIDPQLSKIWVKTPSF